ncbi:MAG TPA: DnaA/Hda family protein, partial [Azospirillaceae bacterium]|nr:DnaA/Hda family protein [Azospirillaceae bacterium]
MSVSAALDQEWARVRGRLKDEVGETAFRNWLRPLTLSGMRGGEVCIVVPTRFMRDWVRTHYADRIRTLWAVENPEVQSVEIVVAQPNRAPGPAPAAVPADAPMAAAYSGNDASGHASEAGGLEPAIPAGGASAAGADLPLAGSDDRLDITAPLDPRFTFENFVVGKPNELAYAAAHRVAEATQVTFNPLFLYGGVGLGKTHLMHAIAWAIRKKYPQRRVLYLSAEKFMYQFIRALRYKDTMAFKQQFRSVDVLMIDDVQFISGKDSTQEEFFHTFNALVDQNRQVIISADKSPSDLE